MIAALYVAVMALFYIGYSWYLILLKRHARVSRVDWPMRHYDRASHGRNFVAQYTPMALLLLGVVEIGGAPAALLHAMGLLLVAAAALHCYSFGFPARMRSGMVAMLLVTVMYGVTSAMALAQIMGLGTGGEMSLSTLRHSGP